ncbi:MAG: CHAT domain-containing protein, partial [Chloroflexia bacterium]|nr:CHAT domain-containing protein [Chloroflexia bacterium]
YANTYERAALLAAQQGQGEMAFFTSERGRARAFLDGLATGAVQLADDVAQQLFAHEQETYRIRQVAQDALISARTADPLDAALVADLEAQLAAAEAAHAAALAAIVARGDELAALVPSRSEGILDVAAVQARLDPQTTLVSFFVGETESLAFVLTPTSFTTVVLEVGQSELADAVTSLRSTLSPDAPAHGAEQTALYQTLFAPLAAQLNTPHLALIPHGPLHYLPFAALSDGERYLGEQFTLSLLPSASVLPFIQANQGRPLSAPLVLGNPDGSLPAATREAQTIAKLFGTEPLLGAAASKQALHERVAEAGILHLAAHGSYNPVAPLLSHLALAPDGAASGNLEAGEVYSLDLRQSSLVVLSACESNLGAQSAGDELVGLTRAFFFAGTPTVVSSLWRVDDAASALLMERFYTHVRAGVGKAQALQQAQADVRVQYPAPYYWAGFVLSGDAGSVEMSAFAAPSWWPWSAAVPGIDGADSGAMGGMPNFTAYLPCVYWGLLGLLGLLWIVEVLTRRRQVVAAITTIFSTGKGRVQQMSLDRDQAGLEQQLARATADVGKHAWEQQVVHPAYLTTFEQLGGLFQQRTRLQAEVSALETQIQQEQRMLHQVKADYAERIKALQEQQKAASGRLNPLRTAAQASAKQLARIAAEQQKMSAEIQALRIRLDALVTSTAPDQATQAATLHGAIAALEQQQDKLAAQAYDVEVEASHLREAQEPIIAEMTAGEQQLAHLQEAQRQALQTIEARRADVQRRQRETSDAISATARQIDGVLNELGSQVLLARPANAALDADYTRIDQLQQLLRERRNQRDLLRVRQEGADRSAPRTIALLVVALLGTIAVPY